MKRNRAAILIVITVCFEMVTDPIKIIKVGVGFGTDNCNYREPEVFQTEVFSWTSARDVGAKMLIFPGFGGPDRSFWPDVRRDILPLWAEFSFLKLIPTELKSVTVTVVTKKGCHRPWESGRQNCHVGIGNPGSLSGLKNANAKRRVF